MTTPARFRKPEDRVKDFDEVCLGYDEESAMVEAKRCLQCKDAPCVDGCPAGIDIPGFIKLITEEKYDDSLEKIKEMNNLPGVCGRVCPQEEQCELKCILQKAGKPISIGLLERFAADNAKKKLHEKEKKNGKKVAIVGSGPSSLSCAADLALNGYSVKMFEALHKPGGVLQYGIPSFRLPRKIVTEEIEYIEKLGVNIVYDYVITKTKGIKELAEEFDSVFLGTGAGTPNFMGIEGEYLCNVYSANEFLTRVNMMNAHDFPNYDTPVKKGSKVVVVGGGNVALDAARVARRMGSDVTIVYRRSFTEMPAREEEIKNAQAEGIVFLMLTNPTRILGEECVEGIECVQMRLGAEDYTGRRSPVPIEGTEMTLDADQVIIAIGQIPNPLIAQAKEVMTGGHNKILVNEILQTSIKNVFAGGDVISGAATVIKAIGDGKKAAKQIDEFLNNKDETNDKEENKND